MDVEFKAIGAAALAAYPGLLRQWFPGGRVYGHEFKVGSLQGEKGESLSINITTGKWADFAANHQGGDPISLYAAMTGVKQGEAAVALAEILGGSLLPEPRQAEAREKAPKRQAWTPVHPVPESAGEPLRSHRDFGKHTTSWAYRDAEGRLLGHICRFDMPDGGKEVLPQSYCAGPDGKRAWRWMSFAKPRPLYGLEHLAASPRANVIIVEGEKCADRARQLFPQHVVVTWPSGGKAVRHADWAPLKGRKIVIWPDADEPGHSAALAIAKILTPWASGVRLLLPPAGRKDGWDAADAVDEGWTPESTLAWLKTAMVTPDEFEQAAREQQAPPPIDDQGGRRTVRIAGGRLADMATEAEQALLAASVEIYQRGMLLVRPVTEEVDASNNRRTKTAQLKSVDDTYLRFVLCQEITWEKYDARRARWVAADPPVDVAKTINARFGHWQFPAVAGVITTPTLRPDGTILSEPGYDPETRLILTAPPAMPSIPPNPDLEDADAALLLLKSLLTEFPFVDPESESVALSALITPVVRGAFTAAPMHAARAPTAGTGKSYLFDTASAIALGQVCPVMAAGRTEEETEKRLVAAAIAGRPIVSIDNVNGELGGDFLCQLIERPIVEPRVLGRSENQRLMNRATVFATGNNLRLVGDMTRRVLLCSLDARVERPEMRPFKENPVAAVMASRGRYVAAALTVIRAYIVAGRPERAPALASFEGWSDTVRSALIWLGCPDPVGSMRTARDEDPELQILSALLAAWSESLGTGVQNGHTAAEVIAKCGERNIIYEDAHSPTSQDWRYPDCVKPSFPSAR